MKLDPLFFEHLPRTVRWLPYLAVRSRMKRYLESAVAGVVHYAETGESVSRNQFGPPSLVLAGDNKQLAASHWPDEASQPQRRLPRLPEVNP